MEKLAPLIAVVGCDGSGKSTLAAELLSHVKKKRGAETVYLGLGSGALGNRIKQWPIIGGPLARFFERRAALARDPNAEMPGLFTAIVLYRYSLKRKRQFERLLEMRRAGQVVVTDRYPQIEVPGFYDGPGLSAGRASSSIVKALAEKERAIYSWMASFVPTLVIRLNIEAEDALIRKPDHDAELILRKVEVTPKLTFNNAPMIDLDATMDYAEEVRLAKAAVDKVI